MIRAVKRIASSDKDLQQLTLIREQGVVRQGRQPVDYKDKVVIKPWGYEFLIFANEYVAIWFLMIAKDHSTSMHCHTAKKTSLTLLHGKALCNTFRHRNFLFAGDSVLLEPAVFHSTKALSLDGVQLIETETPPRKLDLVRLEDKYGREHAGYEDCTQMRVEHLETFRYFHFEAATGGRQSFTMESRFSIVLAAYQRAATLHDTFAVEPGAVYCVCRGGLSGPDGMPVLAVGETEKGAYLRQVGPLTVSPDTLLMKLLVFD